MLTLAVQPLGLYNNGDQPTPFDVAPSPPPLPPTSMCPGNCLSGGATFTGSGGAGSVLPPVLPTGMAPNAFLAGAAPASTTTSAGTCSCKAGVPWWAWLLMGVGAIAIIGRVLRS